uniref:RAD50-interacting protein 1 n=1 Tax=Ciona savignyi TaxID=51511 RepID=H2Y4N9_CIOSA
DEINVYLNQTFGSDVKNLKKIEELFEDTKKTCENLKRKLDLAKQERGEKIAKAISTSESALEHAKSLDGASETIVLEVLSRLDDSEAPAANFRELKSKIDEIERYISYLKWVAKIEETSGGVQQSILSDSMHDACLTFKTLVNHHTCLTDNQTKCRNLVTFLQETIMFWYKILKDKLTRDLDTILKQINYPFLSNPGPTTLPQAPVTAEKSVPSPYTHPDPATHLAEIIKNLQILSVETTILLPFQLLLRPLKRRFRYHFTGTKQTNVIHKPEWYLTQILGWLSNHAGFLEHTIQPVLDENGHGHIDAVVMFTQGLLKLIEDKLTVDIEDLIYVDDLFSHVVDEVLLFDRELRVAYDIPTPVLNRCSPVKVLTQPHCMQKWLNIEKTCAAERLDTLMTSEEAWRSKLSDVSDDIDEMMTPQCAETFVTMLQTITDRYYKNLPSWEEQLQFLDLQITLLDDFRIRLIQVLRSSPREEIEFAIINAARYVGTVLLEWGENLFFLQLKYHKDSCKQSENTLLPPFLIFPANETTDNTVFDVIINLYDRICSEAIESQVQLILSEIHEKCKSYMYEGWLALPTAEEQLVMVVSQSACPMLAVLQDRLHFLEMRLCRELFSQLWRDVAENVDVFLFNEVIVKNHFNSGGAAQLNFDMNRNLFPMFGHYTSKPDNYFKRVKEGCILLNLSTGSALLLREVLEESLKNPTLDSNIKPVDPQNALNDIGVNLILPKQALDIIKRRIEW